MQIASVLGRKSATIINLHWDNLPIYLTSKEWSLPIRNNLQQKQYNPHSNFEDNNQDLKILSPFLGVL